MKLIYAHLGRFMVLYVVFVTPLLLLKIQKGFKTVHEPNEKDSL